MRGAKEYRGLKPMTQYMEQTVLTRAELGDNDAVSALLSLRNDPIAKATKLCALLSRSADQLNLVNLRRLSFLRDAIIPGEGFVSGTAIRSLARQELKKRGAWRMRDRLQGIIFDFTYSDAEE
jgi:hypothetical protein